MTESSHDNLIYRLLRALRRLLRDPLTWVVGGLTVAVSVVLVFDLVPALRGPLTQPRQWHWSPIWPPNVRPEWLLLPLIAGALIGGVLLATRQQARLPGWALAALVLLTVVFQLGVQYSRRDGLGVTSRTLNPAYFGYFPPAAEIGNMGEYLRSYPALTLDWSAPTRLLTHPPGNVIASWLVVRLFEGINPLHALADTLLADRMIALPPWVEGYTTVEVLAGTTAGLIVVGLAALSILPLYALARRTGSERSARLAVGLYPFIPALTVFLPVIDMAYTLLAIGALWLTVSALQDENRWRMALAGLVLAVGSFCSFGLLPLGLMAGLLVLLKRLPTLRSSWRALLLDGLALGAGSLILWGVVWAAWGLNPLVMYHNGLVVHAGLTHTRSYGLWLGYNLWDVLLFAGLPLAVHVVRGLVRFAGRLARRQPLRDADRLLLAFVVTMGLVWISGSVRGETARILLFIMPLLAWLAATDVGQDSVRPAGYGVVVAGMLAGQAIVMQAALNVYH